FSMDGTLVQTPDRAAMLAALERLVGTESPSPDKARCDACADEVAALFAQRTGARATRHPRSERGDHLEIRVGAGTKPILLLCHHDTVWPAGTIARLPFRVDGDRVTGPGGYDMKAGIVEAAFALEGARAARPVIVLSTSDEEIGSTSSRALIEERAREAEAVLVLEPAHARAEIDIRFSSAAEAERIVEAVRALLPVAEGARLRIDGGLDRPPMERGPGTVRLAALAQRLARDLGFRLEETSTGGGSD